MLFLAYGLKGSENMKKPNMKTISKILLSVFIILIFTSFPVKSFAIEDEEKITVRVGYEKGYGLLDSTETLDNKGFGYEVLMKVEHYSNFKFEFIEYDYFDMFDAMRNNEIDIMGIMYGGDYYGDDFVHIEKELGITQLILATKEDGIYYDDPKSIDGKTVASFYGSPYETQLNEYCQENGISIKYIRGSVNEYTDLKADLYLVTTLDYSVKDFNMVMNLDVFNMHFLTSKDNQELAKEIETAINLSISADGTFLEELQIKYYGNKNLVRRYLTRQEVELLRSKTLTCGYIDHHQPIQYTNKDNQPDGISVDIINMLSEQYKFNVEYYACNNGMPETYHENFDILISATGEFEHEMEFYTPTEAFLELPMMIMGQNDIIDEIVDSEYHTTIGMLKYITIDSKIIEERYPNNTVIYYDEFDNLLNAYKSGEVEAILATDHGVEYAKTVLGSEDYSIRSTEIYLPLRVFISNNSENLIDYIGAFNVMFEHISQTEIDEIISAQAAAFAPEYTAEEFIKENFSILMILVLFIILGIVTMVIYLNGKKRDAVLKVINYDDITDLISVYNFKKQASEILLNAVENEYEVISIDIDSFHTINKIYNQERGTNVIQSVAQALTKAYKNSDALITRVIADQFLILHKKNDKTSIKNIYHEYLYPAVKQVLGEKYNVSMSVGAYLIDEKDLKIADIIDYAVAARLKGKRKYDFTYYKCDEEIKKAHEMQTSIVYRMKDALLNNEFKVVYQPKIKFDSLKVGGAEALVRWHTGDENGIIPPNIFINVFEANGFIANLDLYVFEEVCKFIDLNQDKMNIPLISINVSTISLFDNNFPHSYLEVLGKYNLSPNQMELEITESAMAIEQDILIAKVSEIKNLGFFLSIDDFGAGESSLNRLSCIEANTIKLDKAFLDYRINNEKGSLVVDNVIKLAKELNMQVVSEGVETLEQSIWLKSINCDYAQGYFFEKPLAKEDFEKLLLEGKEYKL